MYSNKTFQKYIFLLALSEDGAYFSRLVLFPSDDATDTIVMLTRMQNKLLCRERFSQTTGATKVWSRRHLRGFEEREFGECSRENSASLLENQTRGINIQYNDRDSYYLKTFLVEISRVPGE
jgi:hypothetical protein